MEILPSRHGIVGSVTDNRIDIRPAGTGDHDQWAVLYRGYRDFYRLVPDEAVVDRVWSWIGEPAHETRALVAVDDGVLVGLAHFRRFARPSSGTVGLYLDDLFTDPTRRGLGIGRGLISALGDVAADEGCSVVRWMTSSDNTTARGLYDAVATETAWVTYEVAVPTGLG